MRKGNLYEIMVDEDMCVPVCGVCLCMCMCMGGLCAVCVCM